MCLLTVSLTQTWPRGSRWYRLKFMAPQSMVLKTDEESEESKRGQTHLSASGYRLPNLVYRGDYGGERSEGSLCCVFPEVFQVDGGYIECFEGVRTRRMPDNNVYILEAMLENCWSSLLQQAAPDGQDEADNLTSPHCAELA